MKDYLDKLDELFRLPVDVKVRREDKICNIHHRIGREGGAFTKEMLSTHIFSDEIRKDVDAMKSMVGHQQTSLEFLNAMIQRYRAKTVRLTIMYRKKLEAEYMDQDLKPVVKFVSRGEEGELFFQGFIDSKTLKPTLGSIEDIALGLGF